MNNSRNIAILLIALFVIALGSYAALFSYVLELQAKSLALSKEIEDLASREYRSASARRTLSEIGLSEKQLSAHFVSNDSVVEFLDLLQKTGTIAGTSVEVVSVGSKVDTGAVDVSLKITGKFSAIARTLDAYNNLPFVLTLERGSIDAQRVGGEATGDWQASVSYKTQKYE